MHCNSRGGMGGEMEDVSVCSETSFTMGVCSMCVCFCVFQLQEGWPGEVLWKCLFRKPTAVWLMFSDTYPVYCRNDTVGFGTSVQCGHWLAFLGMCDDDKGPSLRFMPLTSHSHIHNTDRMSVSNTNLMFTKALWDSCNLHLHSE